MTDSGVFWIVVGILTVTLAVGYISKNWDATEADRITWIMGAVLVCLLILLAVAFL